LRENLVKDNIVITSALPYANGEIHLGHIVSTYLPADILSRFYRLLGKNVVFTCASDDFGTPILLQSEKQDITPQKYVEYWKERDLKDFTDLGIMFDDFQNTSSEENIELTQYFFSQIHSNELIYKKEINQLYCNTDEKYLPDRYVLGTCPYCNEDNQYSDGCEKCGRAFNHSEVLKPRCAICQNQPVLKSSMHYFFKLSELSDRLRSWLDNNDNLQKDVKNYVIRWIEDGLNDWDITRDITWGVKIPLEEADGKVLYGWFDNHICYISTTVSYLKSKGIDGKEFWNNSTIYHFIGKDIVYHHYLFLTAMRLAINEEYKLPDYIPTRGHLMLQGEKFSKSRGMYIGLRDFLNDFPADYLRYYLTRITPYDQSDVNFDWDDFQVKINNELVANIGNFIHRALSFTNSKYNNTIPEPKEYDKDDQELIELIQESKNKVRENIENNQIDRAMKNILDLSDGCNRYFQKKEPWKGDSDNTIYLSVNAVYSIAIMLHPFMPHSMDMLFRSINIEKNNINWKNCSELNIISGHKINKPEILFEKIEDKEMNAQKKKIEKTFKG
jgi:methionyl-tRNA synthetase